MPREKRASGAPKVAMTSHDLSVKTAWLYYVEGFTQEQIAQKLDVSRVKVMRTLANCTADGIVVTTINMETTEQVALERALEKRWNLDAAVVVPTPAGDDHLEKAIGHAIALYLGQEMRDGMTLAIGGGATLHASLGFLTRRPLKRRVSRGLGGKPAPFAVDQPLDRRRQGGGCVRGRQLPDPRSGDGQQFIIA